MGKAAFHVEMNGKARTCLSTCGGSSRRIPRQTKLVWGNSTQRLQALPSNTQERSLTVQKTSTFCATKQFPSSFWENARQPAAGRKVRRRSSWRSSHFIWASESGERKLRGLRAYLSPPCPRAPASPLPEAPSAISCRCEPRRGPRPR